MSVVVCVAVGVVLVVRVVEADVVVEVLLVVFSLLVHLVHYMITEAVSRVVSWRVIQVVDHVRGW